MSLKNEMRSTLDESVQDTSLQQPRSLRLRLVLYYGALVAVVLLFFAILVRFLATDALNQSVASAVHAEARIASAEVSRELLPAPTYWPAQLSLRSLNIYQEPGVIVEVRDTRGNARYDSDQDPDVRIPIDAKTERAVLANQNQQYTATVQGSKILVEAVPIRAPGATGSNGPVIGMLLVAKSLGEINTTLSQLQTLLLLSGGAALFIALIGGWVITARALHPLAEMVITARAIARTTARGTRIGRLTQRVKNPGRRDEMAQVVAAFNDMLSDLDKATRSQRRFVADASHELRAPLTTIQGNLSFLQHHGDELPPEERQTMLSDAHSETQRLGRLVEELLLLARADANVDASSNSEQADKNRASLVELDHVVLQQVRQLRGRLSEAHSSLQLEIEKIEPVRVRGNEESISRILLILLDNALKYTASDTESAPGRVTVSVEKTEHEAIIRVSDTGIGIEPAALPHIFERFYRADRARSRQGTGLGLAIAKTLTEQLSGQISAESVPGEGSTFIVRLPLPLS